MEERRGINRVDYRVKSVIVTCDTFEKFYVDAINVSPLGMGLLAPAGTPNLVGRQIIQLGIKARKFTPAVLKYLFEHIAE